MLFSLLVPAVSFFALVLPTSGACPRLPNPLPNATALPVISVLPNPWVFFDGTPLRSTADWECRRAELKTLVQEYFYGYYPDHGAERVSATRSGNNVTVSIRARGKSTKFTTQLTFPPNMTRHARVPVMINPGGVDTSVYLNSGVALATFSVYDVSSDDNNHLGSFWDLYGGEDIGVLVAWAWGYHRIMDALIQVAPEIDPGRFGVTGCSRWGKAALAAGIFDDRVFLSIPMSSGEEGIGPWRFFFEQEGANEKINNIFGAYPWWSTTRLGQFVNDSSLLPFDSHLHAALVAPRAIIWDEGTIDYWTNPQGEASVTFPGTQAVYKWLGVPDNVGVAIRDSGHCDITGYASTQDFMNRAFFGEKITRNYSDISPYTPYTQAFPWINDAPGRRI